MANEQAKKKTNCIKSAESGKIIQIIRKETQLSYLGTKNNNCQIIKEKRKITREVCFLMNL